MWFLAIATSVAGTPDRVAFVYEIGAQITDVAVTSDGAYVGGTDPGAASFWVLDTETWEMDTVAACTGASGAAAVSTEDGWAFYTGCADGTVQKIPAAGGEATEIGSAGSVAVIAVESDETTLYVILDGEANPSSVAMDPETGTVLWTGDTMSAATVIDTTLSGTHVYVLHGNDDVTHVETSAGGTARVTSTLAGMDFVDAFPYPTSSVLYLADQGGGLATLNTGSDNFTLLDSAIANELTSVGVDGEDGWLVLGTPSETLAYGFEEGVRADDATTIEGAGGIVEFVTAGGYAIGGTSDGSLYVLTDRPWVEILTDLGDTTFVNGDTLTLDFTSDLDASWELTDGVTSIESGTSTAGETVTVSTVIADLAEGVTRLYVLATDEATGAIGHDAVDVTVDNPPGDVTLGDDGLGFGDEKLYVYFEGTDDEDLDRYDIYVMTTPFEAGDYDDGGPTFDGDDPIDPPCIATAEPGEDVIYPISPLTNGLTYYVAVRAVDKAGNEGAMSDVQSEMPQHTLSAAERSDELGDFAFCGTGSVPATALLTALAALVSTRRRRAGFGVLAAALLVAPGLAHAKDKPERTQDFEARYGPIAIADTAIDEGFGEDGGTRVLRLEYGWSRRYLELDAGLGIFRKGGYKISESGEISGDSDSLTLLPVTATITGRLQVFDEQPVVPFATAGLGYWFWLENWDVLGDEENDGSLNGGNAGWHWSGGIAILLDSLDRQGASRLKARTGIDDTYIVGEYRQTSMFNTSGFDLSSTEWSFGLKLDY